MLIRAKRIVQSRTQTNVWGCRTDLRKFPKPFYISYCLSQCVEPEGLESFIKIYSAATLLNCGVLSVSKLQGENTPQRQL